MPQAPYQRSNLALLVAALLCALGTSLPRPALAQDQAPATTPPAEAEAEAAVGSSYLAQEHGDWSQLCTVSGTGRDSCELYQLLRDDSGTAVAEITLVDLPEPRPGAEGAPPLVAGAMLITPLETYLPAQLRLAVDDGPVALYRFEYCAQAGCVVRIGLTAEDIAAFRRGKLARVAIAAAAAPDRPVILGMSLAGFTAGYAAVTAANAAAAAKPEGAN